MELAINTITHTGLDFSWNLSTGTVEVHEGEREYWEVVVQAPSQISLAGFYVGAVRPKLDKYEPNGNFPYEKRIVNDSSCLFYLDGGSLDGNGKHRDHFQGYRSVKPGDKVGVLVDLARDENREEGSRSRRKKIRIGGSVQYFVNGKQIGPGFQTGVTGPLVLGVQTSSRDQAATLLPNPRWPNLKIA
jgi:hypothetical protein